jgi:hypothetical protein
MIKIHSIVYEVQFNMIKNYKILSIIAFYRKKINLRDISSLIDTMITMP